MMAKFSSNPHSPTILNVKKCQKNCTFLIRNSIRIMFCPFENFDKTTSLWCVFDFSDRRGGGVVSR